MDQLLNHSELPDRRLINDELVAETARQIEKDLRLPTLDLDAIPKGHAFDRLFSSLLPKTRDLLADGVADLPQKMYQVDLPERYVAEALSSTHTAEYLTEAIIRRCFQKVLLRKLYGRGKTE